MMGGAMLQWDPRERKARVLKKVKTLQDEMTNSMLPVDGAMLFAGRNQSVCEYDFAKAQARVLYRHPYPVNSIIKLGQNLIASASYDNFIKIWNLEKAKIERVIQLKHNITALANLY
jgi:hypothetical protein